jgi:hypothetical protein
MSGNTKTPGPEKAKMGDEFNPSEWITTGEAAALTGYSQTPFSAAIPVRPLE